MCCFRLENAAGKRGAINNFAGHREVARVRKAGVDCQNVKDFVFGNSLLTGWHGVCSYNNAVTVGGIVVDVLEIDRSGVCR